MNNNLSANTKAILLLTAPLIVGRNEVSGDLLTPGEYKRLARHLLDLQRQPADLLSPGAESLIKECQGIVDAGRLQRLLERGFLLSQAIEKWLSRAIWVVSRADASYPSRLKKHLKENAPPVLYGCGDAGLLDIGGLAVVGSRDVNPELIEYTESIGRLAADAKKGIVSGGARGIDQAAMRGALENEGQVVGVMADKLEQAAMNRENRDILMSSRLVLVSPYDPAAGFNVGNDMQRNKLIYALADAALVVSSDVNKGGTWAGAIEQIQKLKLVPVFVRSRGEPGPGLEALRKKGALSWPEPQHPRDLTKLLAQKISSIQTPETQKDLLTYVQKHKGLEGDALPPAIKKPTIQPTQKPVAAAKDFNPAEDLFGKVRELLIQLPAAKPAADIAKYLDVPVSMINIWLRRLVEDGTMKKLSKPIRYQPVREKQPNLFGGDAPA